MNKNLLFDYWIFNEGKDYKRYKKYKKDVTGFIKISITGQKAFIEAKIQNAIITDKHEVFIIFNNKNNNDIYNCGEFIQSGNDLILNKNLMNCEVAKEYINNGNIIASVIKSKDLYPLVYSIKATLDVYGLFYNNKSSEEKTVDKNKLDAESQKDVHKESTKSVDRFKKDISIFDLVNEMNYYFKAMKMIKGDIKIDDVLEVILGNTSKAPFKDVDIFDDEKYHIDIYNGFMGMFYKPKDVCKLGNEEIIPWNIDDLELFREFFKILTDKIDIASFGTIKDSFKNHEHIISSVNRGSKENSWYYNIGIPSASKEIDKPMKDLTFWVPNNDKISHPDTEGYWYIGIGQKNGEFNRII